MYIDGYTYAVSIARRDEFIAYARAAASYFTRHGALRIVEAWEDDVPEGELTSFPLAVKRAPGEAVMFSWVEWPSKKVRDDAYPKIMTDLEADGMAEMPFDGKRIVFGGFAPVVDERA